jgi:hypothetical protein
MAATPISASSRYIPPGTRQYYYVPSIANAASPTRVELDAGTDLTGEVADVSGFQTSSDSTDTPDLKTRFTPKIPGRITADDSSITMYASSDSQDVRQLLPRDTDGFIVQFPEGDAEGLTCDVFPVKVAAAPKATDVEDPAKIEVQFTITAEPQENVTVPAD